MRGVIFDLDGTLVDSLPDVVGSLNAVLRAAGRREVALAEGRAMVGGGAEPLIERAWRATGAAATPAQIDAGVSAFLEEYRARPALETVIFDGALDALDGLAAAGIPLGICTNKPHAMAIEVLRALGIADRFAACFGKGALDVHKPDRRHYDAVAYAMDVPAAETVYVGDSITDVETARAAGVPVVLVTFGYSADPVDMLGADRLIDRFDELAAALRAVAPAPSGAR
jgi:phosphoglycolate phosphatase